MKTAEIQAALKALGYDIGKFGVDGKAGPATEHAIKAFQADSGLAVDGRVGPLTKAALTGQKAPVRGADLPTFPPSKVGGPWPLQRDCMTFFGGVGLHQTSLVLPFAMRLAWDKGVTVRKITLHEKVHDSAARAFANIASAYDEAARKKLGLDLFGGCLNVRKMRGGSSYSMHSWGIAIDFDPERNQLAWGRDKARLAQPDAVEFWKIWEAEGWVSLGRAKNMDWMHVQAARV
ncbi:peptidoglycan-binding protein [Methylobacterium sp. WCS2018Hpa-22]|uniref:peptidoglycan-binding protein n=1 Tax=Methylobacterium sp. WCS2018Hpa-22 TaxID=3073633 RepID=UPI0028897E43|nr:peptidoglycan-binding protein [Methylobacterium sp. WCS2018Hpa-22]